MIPKYLRETFPFPLCWSESGVNMVVVEERIDSGGKVSPLLIGLQKFSPPLGSEASADEKIFSCQVPGPTKSPLLLPLLPAEAPQRNLRFTCLTLSPSKEILSHSAEGPQRMLSPKVKVAMTSK